MRYKINVADGFPLAFYVESECYEQTIHMKVRDFRDNFLFKTTSEYSVFYMK